jgi:hypothetical protein
MFENSGTACLVACPSRNGPAGVVIIFGSNWSLKKEALLISKPKKPNLKLQRLYQTQETTTCEEKVGEEY